MPGSAAAAMFYLHGSIRRGDGAYLTCKMREQMLTVNLCKKEWAMIKIRYNQASDKTQIISNTNDPVRIERTVHVYILHMSNVGIL